MKPTVKLPLNKAHCRLTNKLLTVALAAFTGVTCLAGTQPALAQSEAPTVLQAAGPSVASIQSTVDQFRAALGLVNNGNNPGQASGHREINWDGGSPTNSTTSLGSTPFTVFLNTRGANITTHGSGLSKPHRRAWQIRLGTRATPRSSTRLARCGFSHRLEAMSPRSSSSFPAAMATHQRLPLDLAWF